MILHSAVIVSLKLAGDHFCTLTYHSAVKLSALSYLAATGLNFSCKNEGRITTQRMHVCHCTHKTRRGIFFLQWHRR